MASMGPRSCERGNARSILFESNENEALQWGRARASAEMLAGLPAPVALLLASMGPRSCERGNQEHRDYTAHREDASMGPRSCERGNAVSCSLVLRPGKASMGPRSCERGNAASRAALKTS